MSTTIRQYPLKRGLDLLLALALLILLLPIGIGIVGLVGLAGGPIFFRSPRMGANGHPFAMYKFRTMAPDAEHRLQAYLQQDPQAQLDYSLRYKLKQDPRVTPVGRLLRKYSLDELPQLINVLKGEMSLIGPRPRLMREIADAGRYNARHFEAYYLSRPGMTGLWQVSGRSDLSWEDTVRLDLYYVDNWSMVQDLLILARTVSAVVKGRGAY